MLLLHEIAADDNVLCHDPADERISELAPPKPWTTKLRALNGGHPKSRDIEIRGGGDATVCVRRKVTSEQRTSSLLLGKPPYFVYAPDRVARSGVECGARRLGYDPNNCSVRCERMVPS